MNLIEQLEALLTINTVRLDNEPEYVKADDLRAIIEQAKREAVEPVAIDSGYIEGTAERLRLICSKLGIGAPESNEELMLCQFSLFGLIRGKIDAIYKTQPDHTALIVELVEALDDMVNQCESANARCLDQIGLGLIDIIGISKAKQQITKAREAIK